METMGRYRTRGSALAPKSKPSRVADTPQSPLAPQAQTSLDGLADTDGKCQAYQIPAVHPYIRFWTELDELDCFLSRTGRKAQGEL